MLQRQTLPAEVSSHLTAKLRKLKQSLDDCWLLNAGIKILQNQFFDSDSLLKSPLKIPVMVRVKSQSQFWRTGSPPPEMWRWDVWRCGWGTPSRPCPGNWIINWSGAGQLPTLNQGFRWNIRWLRDAGLVFTWELSKVVGWPRESCYPLQDITGLVVPKLSTNPVRSWGKCPYFWWCRVSITVIISITLRGRNHFYSPGLSAALHVISVYWALNNIMRDLNFNWSYYIEMWQANHQFTFQQEFIGVNLDVPRDVSCYHHISSPDDWGDGVTCLDLIFTASFHFSTNVLRWGTF